MKLSDKLFFICFLFLKANFRHNSSHPRRKIFRYSYDNVFLLN